MAWRGSGEVELWQWAENELGGPFYSLSEAVAVNGITPARNYGEAEVGQGV